MKHIFILFVLKGLLFAEYKDDNLENLLRMIELTNKTEYKKSKEIVEMTYKKLQESGDVVYCLISASVSDEYIKYVIYEMTALGVNTGTKVVFLLQNYISKDLGSRFVKILNDLKKLDYSNEFISRLDIKIAPSLFTHFKVDMVPVLMYSKFTKSLYPEAKNIEYIARGEMMPSGFFQLISERDRKYENYSKIINTSF